VLISVFKRCRVNLKPNEKGQDFSSEIVFDDIKVHVNNDAFSHDSITEEVQDTSIVEYLKQNLKKGDTIINIGHNIGIQTLLMAKLTGQSGRIYFYNPSKKYIDAVNSSAVANNFDNRIVAEPLGISDHTFNGLLVYKNTKSEMHGVIRSADDEIPLGHSAMEIKVTSLDEQLPNIQNVNFIGININEDCSNVINGGINLIKRSGNIGIIVKFDKTHYKSLSIFEKMIGLNFTTYMIQSDGSLKEMKIEDLKHITNECILLKRKDNNAKDKGRTVRK
jgi:FkbM family methyltransferase